MKGRPRPAWLRRFARNGAGMLGLVGVVLVLVMAFGAPLLAPHDPARQYFDGLTLEGDPLPPSRQFPLGTDWVGRDLAARTMKGMWLSIRIGALTALVSTAVSVLFAVLATAGSRWLDRIVSWLVDATIGLPQIVLAILIAFAVGGGTRGVVLAVGLTLWPPLTRLLRAEILKLKEEPFVAMSRAQGHGSAWVIRHHLLPALTPHILVGLAIMFPHAILHESTLTFLGFGIEPTTPSLGIILAEGMRYLSNGQWWAVLGPIAVLVTLATVLDACGDLLRSLLAPVSRHQ